MSSYAVVIGIETYQQSGIKGVDYALADAQAFAALLTERLDVPRENIKLWLNEAASRTQLQEELKYDVGQLGPEDRFFFFYAGHGLLSAGRNRLTAWDTHPLNVPGTTVDLDEVLLAPLRESACTRAAIFLDACAADMSEATFSRDLIADMNDRQFRDFVKSSDYLAVFLSCSPGERSYSSPQLQHGIWTHHLLRALGGDEPEALMREEWLTGQSLQNYLSASVTRFTREKTNIPGRQRPYALLSANGTFDLACFPPKKTVEIAVLRPSVADAVFTSQDVRPYKSLPGFTWKKGHTAPVAKSVRAEAWAQELLQGEVEDELQEIYSNLRKILKLKSRDIGKEVGQGGGSIDSDFFRFELAVRQNDDDPGQVTVSRVLTLRVQPGELPDDFDSVFPVAVNSCRLPLPGIKGKYSDLVDQFEDLVDDLNATLDDDPTTGVITVSAADGARIRIDTTRENVTLSHRASKGCVDLLDRIAESPLKQIAQPRESQVRALEDLRSK